MICLFHISYMFSLLISINIYAYLCIFSYTSDIFLGNSSLVTEVEPIFRNLPPKIDIKNKNGDIQNDKIKLYAKNHYKTMFLFINY